MAKTDKAKTAQEVKEKYGRKRFNSSNAGKSIIYSFIYMGYLKNEGLTNEEIVAQPLYKDLDAIRAKVETVGDAYTFNHYSSLHVWLIEGREAAIFMRNATKSAVAHFYSIVSGTIAGENLRAALGDKAEEDTVALWLSALSVDNIRPTGGTFETVLTLRANTEKGLLYLNVFNTLIAMIAREIDTPELEVFQVDVGIVKDIIAQLNEALEILRDDVAKRGVEPEAEPTSYPQGFTQRELDGILEAFREVSPDAPPIPEENIKRTERGIKETLYQAQARPWCRLFTMLSDNYWRLY